MVHLGELLVLGGEERAAGDHRQAGPLAARDDLPRRLVEADNVQLLVQNKHRRGHGVQERLRLRAASNKL